MNRRDLLKGTVGAAVVGSAVAEAAPEPTPLSSGQLERELRRLRNDLDVLQTHTDFGMADEWAAEFSEHPDLETIKRSHERLLRSTMRTLTISETLSSLPASNRQDPAVLELVGEHAAEMEFAFQGHLAHLDQLSREDKRAIQQALQQDPGLAMDIGDQLDGIALRGGLPTRRRRRLKKLVKHATWRLQRQPLDTVLDELLEGQEKLASFAKRSGTSESLRPIVESKGRVDHWAHEQDTWNDVLGSDAPPPEASQPEIPVDERGRTNGQRTVRKAKTVLTIGGILGGIGAVMIGGGAVSASSGGGAAAALIIIGLFPVTGFIVMMIIGLIVLGVGLARVARERRRKR